MIIEDFNMLPPNLTPSEIERHRKYYLRLQNTGGLFELDKGDWDKAKHCLWWWDEDFNQPINKIGILLIDYLKISGKRKTDGVEKFSFSRKNYG